MQSLALLLYHQLTHCSIHPEKDAEPKEAIFSSPILHFTLYLPIITHYFLDLLLTLSLSALSPTILLNYYQLTLIYPPIRL